MMDNSLKEILEIANIIHTRIVNKSSVTIENYINDMSILHRYVVQMKNLANRLENIYKVCKITNITTNEIKKEEIGTDKWNKNIVDDSRRDIVPNVKINVNIVNTIEQIPNINLYWIANLQQFAIRINDVIIRGNLGNIYNKSPIAVNNCNHPNCTNKKCKFYHDPLIYTNSNHIRNFTNSSWMYTHDIISKKNTYMRHIGNRNTLKIDMDKLKSTKKQIRNNEFDKIMSQTIHDILLLLSIHKTLNA